MIGEDTIYHGTTLGTVPHIASVNPLERHPERHPERCLHPVTGTKSGSGEIVKGAFDSRFQALNHWAILASESPENTAWPMVPPQEAQNPRLPR